MLKNEYLLAKIGVDTEENEPRKESDRQVFSLKALDRVSYS